MPRAAAWLFFLCLLLAPAGCKRKRRTEEQPEATPGALLSDVRMADNRAAVQLAKGFYDPEGNAWRWTQKRFTVVLAPPPGAARRGARLVFHFTLPSVLIAKTGPVTLAAAISGQQLAPGTYSSAGDYVYERDVPATLLGAPAVSVDFETDKALPPTGTDQRELGLVATSVALQPE